MISIVILTKNREAELERAVLSCFQRLRVEKEFVIIDNGDSVKTRTLIQKIAYSHPAERIIYHTEHRNLGVSEGRNLGWTLSKGRYVLFLDDDAVVQEPSCSIEEIFSVFEKHPEVSIIAFDVYDPEYDLHLKPRITHKDYDQALFFIGAGHMICRERIHAVGLYPPVLRYGHEDLFLSLRNYQAGNTIYYENRLQIKHYPSQVRDQFQEEKINGIINKYIVKQTIFPVRYHFLLWLGFIRRNIRFWKTDIAGLVRCCQLAEKRKRKIGNYPRLSQKQARQLLKEFGADFLWEISHDNSDKQWERRNIHE